MGEIKFTVDSNQKIIKQETHETTVDFERLKAELENVIGQRDAAQARIDELQSQIDQVTQVALDNKIDLNPIPVEVISIDPKPIAINPGRLTP